MKRNNSSWVCDRLEELIKEYEEAKADTYDEGTYWTYNVDSTLKSSKTYDFKR